MANYKPTFTRKIATALAREVSNAPTMFHAAKAIRKVIAILPNHKNPQGFCCYKEGAWQTALTKLADYFETPDHAIAGVKSPFRIFILKGNRKLPFAAFSTLPGLLEDGGTCPSAGACLEFCYSFKAWRYPAGYCRQMQNTILIRMRKDIIAAAWAKLPAKCKTLRLYVDGDFDSQETCSFWMALLETRQDIQVYGYSKSWPILMAHEKAGRAWPENYTLNLSSGGLEEGISVNEMSSLEIVRGEFIVVPLSQTHVKGFERFASKAYHQDVLDNAKKMGIKNGFSCPGDCGACNLKTIKTTDESGNVTKSQEYVHACGEKLRLQNVRIVIGAHN